MKKRLTALCALLALLLCASFAAADEGQHTFDEVLDPIEATLNQKMALRTGPGTKYTELGTYPQSTPIVVYEQEIGGSVSWAMLEFRAEGGLVRAYTGMKRIDSPHDIPWANTQTYTTTLAFDTTPRRGPGEQYATMKQTLPAGTQLTVFHLENGYVTADFQYPGDDAWTRAWIPEIDLSMALDIPYDQP